MRYAKRKRLIGDISDFEEITLKKKPQTHTDVQKKTNKFLDAEGLRAVLDELKTINPRIALAMEFISRTGLRIGELLALRTCDYDRDKKELSINGTISHHMTKDGDYRGTPKNIYSVRTVSLDSRSVEILRLIMTENRRRAWAYTGYEDKGYIFTTMRGNPYNLQYIGKQLRKIHIKNKHLTTHIFRHTHISILSELGVPLKAIMQRVGHNDPNTTLSIYTHVTNTMKEEVLNKLDSFVI